MDLDAVAPSLADLRARARRRLPHFVWEYLDSGTGDDSGHHRAEAALDRIVLCPRILTGEPASDLSVTLMGRRQALPFGIAPVGMSGLIRPGAERDLARVAARRGIPYCLSTVSASTPEAVGPVVGDEGWFQLYTPRDPEIRRDMLARARDSGFHTLVVTADLAAASRRERLRRARLTNPMRITPRILAQVAVRPGWALAMAGAGKPRLRTLEKYADASESRGGTEHVGYRLRVSPDWDYLAETRREWPGTLVVKGVLDPGDAARLAQAGVDGIWVSAHGGRQFEAAPAPADALPAIRDAVGPDMPLIADGAVRSGTDILRLFARGADFVMLGRAFHHGLAAFGPRGADHAAHILAEGLKADMAQLGIAHPAQARDRLV